MEDGWGSEPLPGFNDLNDLHDDDLVSVDLVHVGVGDVHADRVEVHALVPGVLLDRTDLLLFNDIKNVQSLFL